MLARLAKVSTAVLAAAFGVLLAAPPAHADGATVVGMPDAIGGPPSTTCTASANAVWQIYPDFGDAAVTFAAQTSCNRPLKIDGTVDLIPNGGSTPVASGSCSQLLAPACTVPSRAVAALPGDVYALRYTTTLSTPTYPFFAWSSVPPHCTVVTSRTIRCTMITFFTVS